MNVYLIPISLSQADWFKLRSKSEVDRSCFGQIAKGRKLKDGTDFVIVPIERCEKDIS